MKKLLVIVVLFLSGNAYAGNEGSGVIKLPSEILIVSCSKHITVVKDGVLHDTYDCSRRGTRCVYGYWTKPQ